MSGCEALAAFASQASACEGACERLIGEGSVVQYGSFLVPNGFARSFGFDPFVLLQMGHSR
jgi:hypothetical protein